MSTKEIIKYDTDVCKIAPYIKQIEGFDANSASPTDTWVISFKDNVYYENSDKTEEPLKRAFIKLFISTDFISYPDTKALEYEIKIYRDIIRPLIDYNVCKNFVKYLSSGLNCTYDDLRNMLENHLYDTDDNINEVYCYNNNDNNEIVLVKINPAFYRLSEVDLLFGNSNKARDELNWKPNVSFIQLVEKMVKNDIELSNI